jgi:beta-glucosidase-like glycosyl hydrolase
MVRFFVLPFCILNSPHGRPEWRSRYSLYVFPALSFHYLLSWIHTVFNGVPSSCFPCSTGLGSSFDVDLALKVGKALGDEARAKGISTPILSFFFLLHSLHVSGCHVLLAPTMNTQRSPLGGRGFESFSEDPHLNGTIGGAYIQGVQSKGVAATIKHYVGESLYCLPYLIPTNI